MKVFYDRDADLGRLVTRRVTIIGYGSQGRAHARNLHDSGIAVTVGVRQGGPSWSAAAADGLRVASISDSLREADVVMLLVPDQEQRRVYEGEIALALRPGMLLLFAHGFNVHYGEITPPPGVAVALVAPKAPGPMVRAE